MMMIRHLRRPSSRGSHWVGIPLCDGKRYGSVETQIYWVNCPDCLAIIDSYHPKEKNDG